MRYYMAAAAAEVKVRPDRLRKRQRVIHELEAMSDRDLADLGISATTFRECSIRSSLKNAPFATVKGLTETKEEVSMRHLIGAIAVVFALLSGATAFAADNGMGTGENGYGYYHESNGAATGWGTQNNGYGLYHESNAGSTGWGNASNRDGYYHESNGSATVSGVQLH
jgi:uncharacterized protein YjiS (DUF1127 family)